MGAEGSSIIPVYVSGVQRAGLTMKLSPQSNASSVHTTSPGLLVVEPAQTSSQRAQASPPSGQLSPTGHTPRWTGDCAVNVTSHSAEVLMQLKVRAGGHPSAHIALHNDSSARVVYKMACTSPLSYCIKPRSVGFIEPNTVLRLSVTLLPAGLSTVANDYFLIKTLRVPRVLAAQTATAKMVASGLQATTQTGTTSGKPEAVEMTCVQTTSVGEYTKASTVWQHLERNGSLDHIVSKTYIRCALVCVA